METYYVKPLDHLNWPAPLLRVARVQAGRFDHIRVDTDTHLWRLRRRFIRFRLAARRTPSEAREIDSEAPIVDGPSRAIPKPLIRAQDVGRVIRCENTRRNAAPIPAGTSCHGR